MCRELAPKHERLACRAFNEAKAQLALPADRVPQLDEVSAGLEPLTGFRFHPAAGLVPLDEFLGSLGDGVFHSTQYLRHPSAPLYTPEPDIVHEVVGHGNLLADPEIAAVKRLAGDAARRCETPEALQYLADVFWFTIEFGVIWEAGELRCYGAGLLSSFGEIDEFRGAEVRPLDFHEMATLEYDITHYQPILFACDGMGELTQSVGGFFAEFDDDTPARLAHGAHARGRPRRTGGRPRLPRARGARQAVVGQLGPDGGVLDVLAVLRADAGIAVDRAEPDDDAPPSRRAGGCRGGRRRRSRTP